MLNAGDSEAHVAVHHFHHFFADRDPMRPYRIMVPARAPLPVPRDRAFSSVFESGVPIVVQHTHTARFEPPRRDLIVNNRLQRILKLRAIGAVPNHFVLFRIKENFRFSQHGFQIPDVEWKYRLNAG
jgi:sensory rhodopsin transducer